jgi:hypothetical protein
MRTSGRAGAAVVLAAVWAAAASGQVPAIPGAPPAVPPTVPGAPALPGGGVGGATPATAGPAAGGAGAGVGGVGTGAGAAGPRNLWSFILRTPEQKAACRQKLVECRTKFCNSRIGQMANGLLLQASPLTGGLLGPICPVPAGLGGPNAPPGVGPPNPADLAMDPNTPQGAAARIKAEENPAVIKAKIEALQFLGTVDCRYYPEAAAGLITGLRVEKNECVRLAAAKALANGCCCNPKIVKALLMVVNCSNKDGFPAEPSELVRAYAYVALERCMRRCVEAEPETPPEPPPAAKAALYDTLSPFGPTCDAHTPILLASYFPPGGGEPPEKIYAEARQALARGLKLSPETIARLSGPRNVADAVLPGVPRITPADVIARLDAVVANAARGPRERTSFVSTLPKREPEPPAASREFVMTAAAPTEMGRPVPVSVTAGPTAGPTASPAAPKSVMSLWKDANRR